MIRQRPRVIVVGGGVIGCAVAYSCARRGLPVVLVDNPKRGRASSASAGGLWPLGESLGLGCGVIFHKKLVEEGVITEGAHGPASLPPSFLDFSLRSNALFPGLVQELRRLTEHDVELERTSLLFVTYTEGDVSFARHLMASNPGQASLLKWLEPSELARLEPSITRDTRGALQFLGDDQINPYKLPDALRAGARALGATVLTHTEVKSLRLQGSKVTGVETESGFIEGDVVVNAAGAWAGQLAQTIGLELPVKPVRGQIVCTETLPEVLTACLSTSDCYLAQKKNGEVIVGSTTEDAGFDVSVTPSAIRTLCRGAVRAVPMLEHVRVKRVWSGLRPGSPDELPILGPVDGIDGYLNAAGHFRTGILNAPLTGELIAQLLLDEETSVPLEPFLAARFRKEAGLAGQLQAACLSPAGLNASLGMPRPDALPTAAESLATSMSELLAAHAPDEAVPPPRNGAGSPIIIPSVTPVVHPGGRISVQAGPPVVLSAAPPAPPRESPPQASSPPPPKNSHGDTQPPSRGTMKNGHYDVAILGSGIAGGTLGLILARAGVRVLILEKDTHPKFAVGESTIPQTSMMFEFMAKRFNAPELHHLGSYWTLSEHVSAMCGIKKGFNYIYHSAGKPQNPDQQNQTILNPEIHLYRQDVDAYLAYKAVSAGATLKQLTEVVGFDFNDSGVKLETHRGTFTAQYVVDASGPASPLAKKFNLRDTPTRCETFSRSIFTHMVDMKLYHECFPFQTVPSPLGDGTLHHIFDGGWIWVIPFNNHERSKNPLCSVGVQLDERFPKNGMTPEQEFFEYLNRLPDAAVQFKGARPVREWVSVDRLQYSSRKTVGNRFCVLGHAAGFIDPLFSRGLANTTETINALAPILINAVRTGDFSEEKFEYVERLQRNQLDRNDQVVRGSYISWVDYDFWNAWFRVWGVAVMLGGLRLKNLLAQYRESGDPAFLPDSFSSAGFFGGDPDGNPKHAAFRDFFDQAVAKVYEVRKGKLAQEAAIRFIYDGLADGGFVDPKFKIANEERRYIKLAIP